ncbi:MAG: hypothetical protein ACHP6H_06840, partial [Legionellales bacterium]
HQDGLFVSWQARVREGVLFIGIGGSKAFYGDQEPVKNQEFERNRNLVHLNTMNTILPECLSLVLGRDTKNQILSEEDLVYLEAKQIAEAWVGSRAVAFDNFPTFGPVYNASGKVVNARCTTHLGSGGVSFGPALVLASRSLGESNELIDPLFYYGRSNR